MVRYPHIAIVTWKPSTKNDVTGDYTDGVEQTLTLEGRLEPASPSSRISDNGRTVEASYKFFTNMVTSTIPVGAILEVLGTKRKIIYVFYRQLSIEIWL